MVRKRGSELIRDLKVALAEAVMSDLVKVEDADAKAVQRAIHIVSAVSNEDEIIKEDEL